MLRYANEEKKRNFLETIELQITLKNYDQSKEKRLAGQLRLPFTPRPRYKVCILANQKQYDDAKAAGLTVMNVADLEKLKKEKKKVKALADSAHSFLASADLIKKLPRLLGPGLNKAGKFPAPLSDKDNLLDKVEEQKATIKFALKAKKALGMGVPIGNVGMKPEEVAQNVNLAINFLVSLLKKNWQNVRRIFIKSTMGPVQRVYGF